MHRYGLVWGESDLMVIELHEIQASEVSLSWFLLGQLVFFLVAVWCWVLDLGRAQC